MTVTPNICPVCGTPRDELLAFCDKCGHEFGDLDQAGSAPTAEVDTTSSVPDSSKPPAKRPGSPWLRRLLVVAVVVVALPLAIVALVTWGGSVGLSTVPIVVCATSNRAVTGSYPPAPIAFPSSAPEPFVPASVAAQLTLYVSADSTYSELAPPGWICTASEGADGVWDLRIHPLADPSAIVTLDAAANGPGWQMACELFPAAASEAPLPGLCRVPSHEVVERTSPTLVLFTDPPGVLGSGQLSGAYTVTGAMRLGSPSGATTRVACALPESQRKLCQTIINATVASWQGQP